MVAVNDYDLPPATARWRTMRDLVESCARFRRPDYDLVQIDLVTVALPANYLERSDKRHRELRFAIVIRVGVQRVLGKSEPNGGCVEAESTDR
jgi:hypothetical protein